MHLATSSLTIRRLRATAGGGDRLAARREWERAFAAADAVPPELAGEGLLVLRHVTWRATQRGLPGLRRWLSAARQRAVCPVESLPAANADAVWFRNEAELLFCLARDWTTGTLSGCWWWAALGLASLDTIVRRWLATPRAAPAAIERLTRAGLAGEFLAALGTEATQALALMVAGEFALPALRETVEVSVGVPSPPPPMPQRLRELRLETPPDLPPPALALWVTSVLLVRHPARLRSSLVESALRQWLKPTLAPPCGNADPAAVPARLEAESGSVAETVEALPEPQTQPAGVQADASKPAPVQPEEPAHDQIRMAKAAPPLPSRREPATGPPGNSIPRFDRGAAEAVPPPATPELVLPPQRMPESETHVFPLLVRTDFGGVFYLLNVALDLGIYSDFTRPRGPNLALSPFDWLALLGRHWFAAELEADPLWWLLAGLAGRAPEEPPGFPEGLADPEGWLKREAERVHQRLVAGLPEAFARKLPDCVCRQDAEVCVSHQRVEVRFALAVHPLTLRLSGLDRDPGWLPAAGREIVFHYD